MKYKFIPFNEVPVKLNIKSIDDSRNIYSDYFLNRITEVIYVVDDEKHLIGLVTPSDMDRLYYNDYSSPIGIINRKYTFLEECDYKKAAVFFGKYKRCHEIPVIRNGKFEGVLFDGIGKDSDEWKDIFKVVSFRKRMERNIFWYCDSLKKLMGKWYRSNVLIYGNLRDAEVFESFSVIEKEKLFERKGLKNREVYNNIIDGKWNGKNFFDDYNKIRFVSNRGIFHPEDMETSCININNHKRIVPNIPTQARRKAFLFGPCNVFGAYVSDGQTIEAHLQNLCVKNGILDIEVVNCGLMGPERCLDSIFVTDIKSDDIVIILTPGFDWIFKDCFPESYKGCLSDVYDRFEHPTDHFLDNVRHCDGEVNEAVAERIWVDLERAIQREPDGEIYSLFGAQYFIAPDVTHYFERYFEKYFCDYEVNGIVGAIVMNCNPFTNGHRYLVEYAATKVDKLIVFVVEEDKSFYPFVQRLEMVKQGLADMDNVIVVPSGRYIISKETFAQYFEKEDAIDVDDMDYDIYLFGDIVAKKLGISQRFVGDEPTDIVTAKYNDRMKEILPDFDVAVEIIDRKQIDGEVVSATKVREAYKLDDWETVGRLCPESTVECLKKLKIENI